MQVLSIIQKIVFTVVVLSYFLSSSSHAQHPHFFTYDDDGGLPSNEVYSIIEDSKGFIWIGCATGLYKFDGISYTSYKSAAQKSKSVTDLVLSASGRLYCKNFQSQIFYVEGDSLTELKHGLAEVPNFTCDKAGNVFINHAKGISSINDITRHQTHYTKTANGIFSTYTNAVAADNKNNIYFVVPGVGIGSIEQSGVKVLHNPFFKENPSLGFHLISHKGVQWAVSVVKAAIFIHNSQSIERLEKGNLYEALKNRKVTGLHSLSDGYLWITTYTGVIRYDTERDIADIFYPDYTFSDCLIDREGSYWFSTLQTGLMRVSDLRFTIWNADNRLIENDRLVKVTTDGQHIYYASINGAIGKLNIQSNELKVVNTGSDADIQCLNYIGGDKCVYYYVNNTLYALKNNNISTALSNQPPIKNVLKAGDWYFLMSSFGTYIHSLNNNGPPIKLSKSWSRSGVYDSTGNVVWIASNTGIVKFLYSNNSWTVVDTIEPNIQILSIDYDTQKQILYALTYNGKIMAVTKQGNASAVCTITDKIDASSIKLYKQKLYLCTNKGLLLWDIEQKKWQNINAALGIASDNLQDLQIINEYIWLATSKGLQKVPLEFERTVPLAKLYLKEIKVAEKSVNSSSVYLNYTQSLTLFPEVSSYSSNGKFQYAYRIKTIDTAWNFLPGDVTQITIPNIPVGNFTLELKAVDYSKRNSVNTITLKGVVAPPFWQSNWFIALMLLLFIGVTYFIYLHRIKLFKHKQAKEIERLNLENELRLTQQTALKAQMNPHFIFNVLNSIKGYIYKSDKQNASAYLNDFSDLIRLVLDMSSLQYVCLDEELRMLKLYIRLEAMLLQNNFNYTIDIDDAIDTHNLKVPSLIIQPYIENAFKHGLRHKNGAKHLGVSLYQENSKLLVIEIADNGIGRVASQALNKTEVVRHESFATNAIEKRITLLNKEEADKVSAIITDLYDNVGNSTGTKVTIKILVNE